MERVSTRSVLKEALFYTKADNKVICELCPHRCSIREGAYGICKVRRNTGGRLFSENYGVLSAIHFDPVEKKPLYHFFPGKLILSLGSVGCNMKCKCCQNWQISQTGANDFPYRKSYVPEEIVEIALSRQNNIGVAYTYNEPTVWYEYMLDTARLVHEKGMKNAMVSNGYMSPEPLQELTGIIDGFNIDLKAFNDRFYRSQTGAKLEPVKETLKFLSQHNKHVEVTNLVIPSLNDSLGEFTEMIKWLAGELGNNTVLHLSRYHPMYKLEIQPTGNEILSKFYDEARRYLNYVYVGNTSIKNYQDTQCSGCGKTLIRRSGYTVECIGIDISGKCIHCGTKVIVRN